MKKEGAFPLMRWGMYAAALVIVVAGVLVVRGLKKQYRGAIENSTSSRSILVTRPFGLSPDGSRLAFQVVGESPTGTTSTVEWLDLKTGATGSVAMPDATAEPSGPVWTGAGDTILFTLSHAEPTASDPQICACPWESGRIECIRGSMESYAIGWFAPIDTNRVVFSQIDVARGTLDLWVMDVRGRNARQLTRLGDVNPDSITVSPTGGRIAFARDGGDKARPGLWLTDLLGGVRRLPGDGKHGRPGIFSPDGAKMMWYDGFADGIEVLDLATGKSITVASGQTAREAVWSPTGTDIAFVTPGYDLYVAPIDGSVPPKRIVDSVGSLSAAAWTKKDGLLIIVRNNSTIWTVTPGGAYLRQVFPRPGGA